MKYLLYILILISSCLCPLSAQEEDPEQTFNDAEYFFATGEYEEACILFTKLVNLNPENANFNFRTGMSYLNIPGRETQAIPYLEKAAENISMRYKQKRYSETQAPHHTLFYLGNAYRINNELDKALDTYERFKSIRDFEKKYNIRIVDNEIAACERAKIIQDSPLNLVLTNIGQPVNSDASDYAPVVSDDESFIVFMSSQRFYEAIMYSEKIEGKWSAPVNITPQVGSDGNMIPTSLSKNKKELYLVRKEENNSDIYLSTYNGNMWSRAFPLNSNINTRANETFASVSNDGKQLFFTSDRKGSLGGLDIWISKKSSVGDWGPAENAGSIVNTSFDEESPFLSPDGKVLFFSSKGHFNMGGFDVFYAPVNKYGQFEETVNIGYPLNTTNDNLYYYPLGDGKTGYMAMFNKESDQRNKDIFRVELLPFTESGKAAISKFDRDFTINLKNTGDGKTIIINYNKENDQFIINDNGENYTITISEKK